MKSKELLVDMELEGGNILRKLSLGYKFWFADIEVKKTDGFRTTSKIRYYSIERKQYPTFEDVMRLINTKFAKPLPPQSLPASEGRAARQ